MASCCSWIDDPNHWFSSAAPAQLSRLTVSSVLCTFISSSLFSKQSLHFGILLTLCPSWSFPSPVKVTHPASISWNVSFTRSHYPFLLILNPFIFSRGLDFDFICVSVSTWKVCSPTMCPEARDVTALSVTHFVPLTTGWRLFSHSYVMSDVRHFACSSQQDLDNSPWTSRGKWWGLCLSSLSAGSYLLLYSPTVLP